MTFLENGLITTQRYVSTVPYLRLLSDSQCRMLPYQSRYFLDASAIKEGYFLAEPAIANSLLTETNGRHAHPID